MSERKRSYVLDEFWREKGLEQLAEEQGVGAVMRLEDVMGRGAALWDGDEDFEEFVRGICERRHDKEFE